MRDGDDDTFGTILDSSIAGTAEMLYLSTITPRHWPNMTIVHSNIYLTTSSLTFRLSMSTHTLTHNLPS